MLDAGKADSVLSGASAVSWYLASQGKRAGIDTKQQSQVWQWLSFAENELIPVACAVVFPLMGVMGLDKKVRRILKRIYSHEVLLSSDCVLFILRSSRVPVQS